MSGYLHAAPTAHLPVSLIKSDYHSTPVRQGFCQTLDTPDQRNCWHAVPEGVLLPCQPQWFVWLQLPKKNRLG